MLYRQVHGLPLYPPFLSYPLVINLLCTRNENTPTVFLTHSAGEWDYLSSHHGLVLGTRLHGSPAIHGQLPAVRLELRITPAGHGRGPHPMESYRCIPALLW